MKMILVKYTWPDIRQDTVYLAGYTAGYRIPGLIYGRIPYTWPDIRQDTVYLAWYTAGYRIPGLVYGRIPYTWPDIRPDTVYLAWYTAGYRISCRLSVPSLIKSFPWWDFYDTFYCSQANMRVRSFYMVLILVCNLEHVAQAWSKKGHIGDKKNPISNCSKHRLLLTYAPISELPSNISTVESSMD